MSGVRDRGSVWEWVDPGRWRRVSCISAGLGVGRCRRVYPFLPLFARGVVMLIDLNFFYGIDISVLPMSSRVAGPLARASGGVLPYCYTRVTLGYDFSKGFLS